VATACAATPATATTNLPFCVPWTFTPNKPLSCPVSQGCLGSKEAVNPTPGGNLTPGPVVGRVLRGLGRADARGLLCQKCRFVARLCQPLATAQCPMPMPVECAPSPQAVTDASPSDYDTCVHARMNDGVGAGVVPLLVPSQALGRRTSPLRSSWPSLLLRPRRRPTPPAPRRPLQ
jgi:hypothetical protein